MSKFNNHVKQQLLLYLDHGSENEARCIMLSAVIVDLQHHVHYFLKFSA